MKLVKLNYNDVSQLQQPHVTSSYHVGHLRILSIHFYHLRKFYWIALVLKKKGHGALPLLLKDTSF